MRARAGIIGGVIGGFVKLILDQLTFSIGISSVDTTGTFSRILFGTTQASLAIWIVYLVVTGLAGWLVSALITEKSLDSYLSFGIVVGAILWAFMNIVFTVSGIVIPTWSMGASSFVVNLITHIILGISITYAMSKYRVKATA